jgi:hypothetical protein
MRRLKIKDDSNDWDKILNEPFKEIVLKNGDIIDLEDEEYIMLLKAQEENEQTNFKSCSHIKSGSIKTVIKAIDDVKFHLKASFVANLCSDYGFKTMSLDEFLDFFESHIFKKSDKGEEGKNEDV